MVGIFEIYTGIIFFILLFQIIIAILTKKDFDYCFVPSLLYQKDDENFYFECIGRYNCCYTIHFFYYVFGIVVIMISDYLQYYEKNFCMASVLVLNLFTGGLGSMLLIDVFITGENGERKKCSWKYKTVLFESISAIPIHYNAVYFLFFHDVDLQVLKYLFLPVYIVLYLAIGYNFYNYGNYDKFI